MTITDAKNQILTRVKIYLQKAEEIHGVRLNPTIRFDLKGTTMGTANSHTNELRFNLTALQVEGGWDHLFDHTVPHEVAHLVQYNHPTYPRDRKRNPPHGQYWKRIMRDFEVKAQRCHSVALPKARTTSRVTYHCSCRSHDITMAMHNKIQKGSSRRYLRCKTTIKFGEKPAVPRKDNYPFV